MNIHVKAEAKIIGLEAQKVWHIDEIAKCQKEIKELMTLLDVEAPHNEDCTCPKCEPE